MAQLPSLREMLQAGVHFCHRTSRWHPGMGKYIFTSKSGVHVINLEETVKELDRAVKHVKDLAAAGKIVLFVGTKKQASQIVKDAATECGMPYVHFRWLGGMLTNFDVIKESVKKFQAEKELLESGATTKMSKRDATKMKDRVEKEEKVFGGLTGLERRPDAIVLVGAHDEKNAMHEAKQVGIPIIGLVDTNTNPALVDFPIPANDDATKSISLLVGTFAKAIKDNKGLALKKKEDKESAKTEVKDKALA